MSILELVSIKGVTYEIHTRKGSKNLTLKPIGIPVAKVLEVVIPKKDKQLGEFTSSDNFDEVFSQLGI